MITRKWIGVVSRRNADKYAEFLSGERGIGEYRSIPGNRGAILLRRDGADTTEFELLSFWDDADAIKRYAGTEYERPHYHSDDLAVLINPAQSVEHSLIAACDLQALQA